MRKPKLLLSLAFKEAKDKQEHGWVKHGVSDDHYIYLANHRLRLLFSEYAASDLAIAIGSYPATIGIHINQIIITVRKK